jgi:hypothetical protein
MKPLVYLRSVEAGRKWTQCDDILPVKDWRRMFTKTSFCGGLPLLISDRLRTPVAAWSSSCEWSPAAAPCPVLRFVSVDNAATATKANVKFGLCQTYTPNVLFVHEVLTNCLEISTSCVHQLRIALTAGTSSTYQLTRELQRLLRL